MQERQRSAASTAGDWQRRAEMALRAGDEDLARAALTRRKSYQVTGHTPHPARPCMTRLIAHAGQAAVLLRDMI